MGYGSAKEKLKEAMGVSADMGVRRIAEALLDLTRAIEDDFNKLEREIKAVESKVRRLN
jgi:hypothetical protein